MPAANNSTPPSRKPLRLEDVSFDETRAPEPAGPPFNWLYSKKKNKRARWRAFWIFEPLQGGANFLGYHVFRYLPATWGSGIAARLSFLAIRKYEKHEVGLRVRNNLRILRPDLSSDQDGQDSAVARWWQNAARAFAEFAVLNKFWRLGLIEVEGAENLYAATSTGRNIIFASVHVGSWEGLAAALQTGFGFELTGPYQPEPSRFTNRRVYKLRKLRGQFLFPPGQRSAFLIHRLLTSGSATGIFFVDEVRNDQIHFPLFGRPVPSAGNMVNVVKLAKAANALIVPVYMARKHGVRFTLRFLPSQEPASGSSKVENIQKTAANLNEIFEPIVLKHLEQWYMLAAIRAPENPVLLGDQTTTER